MSSCRAAAIASRLICMQRARANTSSSACCARGDATRPHARARAHSHTHGTERMQVRATATIWKMPRVDGRSCSRPCSAPSARAPAQSASSPTHNGANMLHLQTRIINRVWSPIVLSCETQLCFRLLSSFVCVCARTGSADISCWSWTSSANSTVREAATHTRRRQDTRQTPTQSKHKRPRAVKNKKRIKQSGDYGKTQCLRRHGARVRRPRNSDARTPRPSAAVARPHLYFMCATALHTT